jgi:hypothetical protein
LARTFSVFGINEEDGVTGAQHVVGKYSNADVEAVARDLFRHCAVIEIWEASILIARIRRDRA